MICLGLLQFAQAHEAYRRADAKELKSRRWKNSKNMKFIEQYEADRVRQE